MRQFDQSDLNAAARGLRMLAMSTADLRALIAKHTVRCAEMFASRVIVAAARQLLTVKVRNGARA